MNYQNIYNALVEKAKVRGLDKSQHEGYFEIHHIVPRCLGGSDEKDNLVMFTGREHFIAHMLLWKAYPKNPDLMHAAWMMSHTRNGYKVNSVSYEALSVDHSIWLSERMGGVNSPQFKDLSGQRNGKLTVIEHTGWKKNNSGFSTSLWLCKCDCGNYRTLQSKEVSLDSKSAYKSCGCLVSETSAANIGEKNPFFGMKHSEEARSKMALKKIGRSPSNKGVLATQEKRDKIKAKLAEIPRFPWTHPMVTKDDIRLEMWKMAEFYFDLYLTNKDLTKAKYTTLYNKLYCDTLLPSALAVMHDKFTSGWIPALDNDWLEFSEGNLVNDRTKKETSGAM